MTGLLRAEGKDHLVSLNSGEVKRVLMGSLAGPESPKPWSHKMKLRAMGSCWFKYGFDRRNSMKMMVLLRVAVNRTIGLVNNIAPAFLVLFSFISNFVVEMDVKRLQMPLHFAF